MPTVFYNWQCGCKDMRLVRVDDAMQIEVLQKKSWSQRKCPRCTKRARLLSAKLLGTQEQISEAIALRLAFLAAIDEMEFRTREELSLSIEKGDDDGGEGARRSLDMCKQLLRVTAEVKDAIWWIEHNVSLTEWGRQLQEGPAGKKWQLPSLARE